ncbi:MAG: hypothetical protein EOM65_15895, partial [Synergistales bacterium]|nr:hypothetical protein [Synergistales bacterium]
VQLFRPLGRNEYILGAVGVLQFDVTISRLKAEYGVDADYDTVNCETARWVTCDDDKRLADFRKENQNFLAIDGEGNLAFLADGEWRLKFVAERGRGRSLRGCDNANLITRESRILTTAINLPRLPF